eukprot:183882-Amphidinium_carterae.1
MNEEANLPRLADGLKLEQMQQHDADTTTNKPIPCLFALPIAPQLQRDDDDADDANDDDDDDDDDEMSVLECSPKNLDDMDVMAPVIDNTMSLNPLPA